MALFFNKTKFWNLKIKIQVDKFLTSLTPLIFKQ